MATATPRTDVSETPEYTAIDIDPESAAGKRRKSRKGRRQTKKRGGAFKFTPQEVNTASPPAPNAPQGPLGGRRRKTRKTRRSTKKCGGRWSY